MALELARALAATERDDNLHIARLLLLMAARAGEKRHSIEGLTKLAKLDFLLRYPNSLERALKAAGKKPEKAEVADFERTTIESKMVRFRYGPWDHRYRRWVALMAARGCRSIFERPAQSKRPSEIAQHPPALLATRYSRLDAFRSVATR